MMKENDATIYIAFLRGINVGGHRKIKMQDLKLLLKDHGLRQVSTYIQSGNIIFTTEYHDITHLTLRLEKIILDAFGFEVKVIIRTAPEIQQIIAHSPFLKDDESNISKCYVTLLSDVPDQARKEYLLTYTFPQDEYQLHGKTIYLHCMEGYGKTKLTNDFFEKKLKQMTTSRNWKTMQKMHAMALEMNNIS